jgi:ubiquinone/menaquinone biosynthesis C-methylase UbiE
MQDFKRALKPGGRMLIIEHMPPEGKTERGPDTFLHAFMMGKWMDMKVVPPQALEAEAKAAGLTVLAGISAHHLVEQCDPTVPSGVEHATSDAWASMALNTSTALCAV